MALNVYATTLSQTDQSYLAEIGGIDVFQKFSRIAKDSIKSFSKVFTTLKTYATLRHLQSKNIDVTPYLDKFKTESPDYILNVYEQTLAKIGLYTQGEEAPTLLNRGIRDFAENMRENPDIGIPFPLPIVSTYTRGLKKGTVTGLFAHTNKGKTRILTDVLTDISIKNKIRTMFISTEQSEQEMKLQYLTSIWNNIIAQTPDDEIEESALAIMELTDSQEKMLEQTISYFEENCDLYFKCVTMYDLSALKRYMKLAHLKGCELVCIDVLKPCRLNNNGKYNEWQEFAATVEAVRNLAKELNLAVLFTAHLSNQSSQNTDLEVSSIANGTQIAFITDVCLMFRDITLEEKMKYQYRLQIPDHTLNGENQAFMITKNYMSCKIVKNRFGRAGDEIVLEVEKGKNKFRELGFFSRAKPPKE